MSARSQEVRWRRFARACDLLTYATLGLGALLAIFAPLDVLSRSPLLAAFADRMSAILPVIAHYTAASQFPEVTKLYMAMMFCGSPWFFLSGFFSQWLRGRPLLAPVHQSVTPGYSLGRYRLAVATVVLGGPLLAYFHVFINPGLDIWVLHFSTSRIALGLFGFVITAVIPGLIGLFALMVVRLYITVDRFFE